MKGLATALALALALTLFPGTGGAQLSPVTVSELFQRLPDSECGGYGPLERQRMLEEAVPAPGNAGRTPGGAVEPLQPWVEVLSPNYLVLHRPGFSEITYKLFDGRGFQLLAVCRSRQHSSAIDRDCRFGLCLYRQDRLGLSRVEPREYFPGISILDFVTVDTLADPRAVEDIARRAPAYGQCLVCNLSSSDSLTLDLVTVTTVNAAACLNFLPPFGLLPLTWNGLNFTKPYDRASARPQ
ncbi:MAG: hypothetical protein LBP33_10395 [Candidatus Adiutrix sp.]|jgi:hypothetical protein|nr:hypothetical protein [Candidatus Adiutrix sp.]